MIKFICSRHFLLKNYPKTFEFKIGDIVEKENDTTYVFLFKEKLFIVENKKFNKFFIPLAEWREKRIDKILND
jgi:hypothetical protein